jgi:hypothetical protein
MDVTDLDGLLTSGPVWGAEIDTRYRVLALTVEPDDAHHPDPSTADRRLQVLLHPVSAVAASLVQQTDDGPALLRFDQEQLPDIVAALDGAIPEGPVLADRSVDLDALNERLSLRGQATVGDGTLHHLHLQMATGDLVFELWASFDEVVVRGPDDAVEPPDVFRL